MPRHKHQFKDWDHPALGDHPALSDHPALGEHPAPGDDSHSEETGQISGSVERPDDINNYAYTNGVLGGWVTGLRAIMPR